MLFGREKRHGERDWRRRIGYAVLGELHIPGRLRVWHIIRELRRLGLWSSRPLTVLDAGGGEGAFAYFLARKFPGWKVVVADNEPATIARGLRIKSRLNLANLDVREADLVHFADDALYDLIICSDVLEHIVEDELVVKGLAQVLKPGGVLIVTSPSVPQPRHLRLVAWRERRVGFKPSDYGHVRAGYSHQELRRVMGAAGLDVERTRTTFGPFGTLMFDLFFVTGDNRPNPIVYLALLPLYLVLSVLDLYLPGRHGAAILGVGRKP
jgi:2-polyprenyl-3-methyl-5-hydroxy-6-metoxy-1,4-benzoquinol methylase